jgi:CheY-like chemotaxis protein
MFDQSHRAVGSPDRLEERVRTLEARLARAEQLAALGRLVAGAVHELNNPLTVVQGYAELLQDQPLPPAVIQRLKDIHGQARQAADIVAGLVRLSQSLPGLEESSENATPPDTAPQSCDLAEVIHETVAACAGDLAERGVVVHVRADSSLFVAAEPGHVRRLLSSMLRDAGAAAPSGSGREIRVSGRRSGDHAELSVTGAGARQRTSVALQVIPDTEHPGESGGAALVIAEEDLARALWQETLINQNWKAEAAATPGAALHQIEAKHFDVVVIDTPNPLQDGLPLRAEMNRRGWQTPLVLVTGEPLDPASRLTIEQSGCLLLRKPFRIGQLREVLARTLVAA